MSTEAIASTPLMLQYQAIKKDFPDALLLFQVGDFYELFYDDAKKAAAFLAITLTARGKNNGDPIPLCGVPVHAAEFYIAKLVKGGFKVALCNQLEPATPGKVVERGVAQVFTPGTLTDAKLLDDKSASYLFSFFPLQDQWGLLFAELMTAQLYATVLPAVADKTLAAELGRFCPDEVIIPAQKNSLFFESYFSKLGFYTSIAHYDEQTCTEAERWICQQFSQDLQVSIKKYEPISSALNLFYGYIKKNQESSLPHFNHFTLYQPEDFLLLDAATQRNLELVKNMHDGSRKNSLYEHLDHAVTAMGSRTIKKWILRPLVKKEAITSRQEIVQALVSDVLLAQLVKKILGEIGDLERIVGRIMLARATLSDFNALKHALRNIPLLKSELEKSRSPQLQRLSHQMSTFDELGSLLEASCNNDTTRDWIIKAGFNQQLDHLRAVINDHNAALAQLEKREQQKTGITSLKVRYTSLYGYYIEVTKVNAQLVPDYFIRAQSLVSKDRFTTIELKSLEAEFLIAQNQITQLERELFEQVKRDVMHYGSELRKLAYILAHFDALFGLCQVAYQYGYVRPSLTDEHLIEINKGKHPIIAQSLGNKFIPNATSLNTDKSLWIVTGPNMGGKSTYLRQVALIVLMAHIGSFVPSDSATIALRDRIFTRVGAGDNVAEGKSTFLIEMEEAAVICQQATDKSLIILDELGRGTSTFDGFALAQAVIEYLQTAVKAPCLFATHYHELTSLADTMPGVACCFVASKRTPEGVLFLHTLEQGVADGSFGIEVAKLAGLPSFVIRRAEEILQLLEDSDHNLNNHSKLKMPQASFSQQNELEQYNKRLLERIALLERSILKNSKRLQVLDELDFNDLSPKKAFDILWQIRESQ